MSTLAIFVLPFPKCVEDLWCETTHMLRFEINSNLNTIINMYVYEFQIEYNDESDNASFSKVPQHSLGKRKCKYPQYPSPNQQ